MLTALLVLIFGLAAVGIWCILASQLFVDSEIDPILFVAALALAPALVAWHCALTLRVLPGEAPLYYVVSTVLLCSIPLAMLVREDLRRRLATLPRRIWNNVTRAGWVPWILGFLVLEAFALIWFMAWLTPLRENDALEYATVARLIFERRTLAFYPIVDPSDIGSFYAPWTHPAGYPALLGFSNFVQGHASIPGLIRFPAVYSALSLALLVWAVGGRKMGGFAAIIALGTPLYFVSAINGYVDPVRISASFAALVLVTLCLLRTERPSASQAGWLGIGLGLAFFCHSIGIVVIMLAVGLTLVLCRQSLPRSIMNAAIMTAASLAVVAPDIAANITKVGAIVADVSPVSNLPEVRALEHLRFSRNLDTPYQLLRNGLLRGFTDPATYGLTFWIASAGFGIGLVGLRRVFSRRLVGIGLNVAAESEARQLQIVWMLIVAAWMAMAAFATTIGVFEFIKNPRYILTILPPLALLGGWAITTIGEPATPRSQKA